MQRSTKNSLHRKGFQGIAVVSEEIIPWQGGRVRFQSSWWPAMCDQNICIMPGTLVTVVGLKNITLVVEPYSQRIPDDLMTTGQKIYLQPQGG